MDENDLLAELAQGENQHREFKRQLENPESTAGEIVAFANSEGGCLYFGVADDGAVVGLADSAATFQSLTHLCRDRCIPPVSPVLEQQTVDGRDIVALTVLPALNRLLPPITRRNSACCLPNNWSKADCRWKPCCTISGWRRKSMTSGG
ncbi:MAG TPA: ATP-binding protein [Candidatus Competibacteraceae bacterium]|mgnify:CR=1 FL=1|nr:ATP-binding protein [Candidatus Competibacteraceae bacterium]